MGNPGVLIRLLKKPYPSALDRKILEKQKEIEMKNETEETGAGETAGVERSFFVENAEKGIYTCVMENKEGKSWRHW